MTDEAGRIMRNGQGAAAVLAAAIGFLVLGVLALAGDAVPAFARRLDFWRPTGPLSGVTDIAILAWLAAWVILGALWRGRDIDMRPIGIAAIVMTITGLVLTFPPVMDLLQGR